MLHPALIELTLSLIRAIFANFIHFDEESQSFVSFRSVAKNDSLSRLIGLVAVHFDAQ